MALSATATLRRTLRDLTLTEVRAGGSSETVAIARSDLIGVLEKTFGVVLDAEEADRLARLMERKAADPGR